MIVVIEVSTMELVSVWFLPGALTALVLSLFQVTLPWQISVFVVMAVLSFVPLLVYRKKKVKKDRRTNIDAVIGRVVLITERVSNIEGTGAAKLGGQIWTARAEDEETMLDIGERAEVVAVQGVKLICRKKA